MDPGAENQLQTTSVYVSQRETFSTCSDTLPWHYCTFQDGVLAGIQPSPKHSAHAQSRYVHSLLSKTTVWKATIQQCLFACVLFEVCFPFLWDKKESTPRVRLANEALSIATPPFFPPPSVKCFGDWSGPGLLWHMEGSYFTRPDVEDLQVSVCNVGTAFSGLQAEKKKKKNFPLPIPFLLLFPSLSPLCHYILTTGLFLLPSLLKNATPLRSCSKLPALGGKRISSCWWTLGSEMNLATPMCSANPGRPRELPAAAQEFGVLGR